MPLKCNACNGVYGAKTADGSAYYHACPPATLAKDGDPLVERANKRDENVTPVEGKVGAIKLAGAGTTTV